MPTIYRVQIVKSLPLQAWSNDYIIHEETIEDAEDVLNDLVTFERNMHMDAVQFDYARISTVLPDDRYFRHIALNLAGLLSTSDYLPIFNAIRVDMPTSTSDPCRKYFRGPIAESNQQNGVLTGAAVTFYNGVITTYLTGTDLISHIWTPKGNVCVGASLYPYVQMRQLHRRRRPVTP